MADVQPAEVLWCKKATPICLISSLHFGICIIVMDPRYGHEQILWLVCIGLDPDNFFMSSCTSSSTVCSEVTTPTTFKFTTFLNYIKWYSSTCLQLSQEWSNGIDPRRGDKIYRLITYVRLNLAWYKIYKSRENAITLAYMKYCLREILI